MTPHETQVKNIFHRLKPYPKTAQLAVETLSGKVFMNEARAFVVDNSGFLAIDNQVFIPLSSITSVRVSKNAA